MMERCTVYLQQPVPSTKRAPAPAGEDEVQ
jgi:hypothetical protein